MKNLLIYIFAIFSFSALLSCDDGIKKSLNVNWKEDLSASIESFKECNQSLVDGVNPCAKYIGESVNTVYNVNEFYSEKLGRYLTVTEINDYLNSGMEWQSLGKGSDQNALTEAQNYSNDQNAVLAVYMTEDKTGHVSIILPGELTKSGSWGLEVPNSASFFMSKSQKSYLDKGLSYAFSKEMLDNVTIYVKIY